MSMIFYKIRKNFLLRIKEVNEGRELLNLAEKEKNTLLKNIYEEQNIKLKIVKDAKRPHTCMNQIFDRYEQNLDRKYT